MDYSKLSKKALTCMYVKTFITSVFWTGSIWGVQLAFKNVWPEIISTILYAVIAVIVLNLLIAPKIRYERYRYRLTEEEFEVREGLIVITTAMIPIERLHKIEVSAGPIFRAFGLKAVTATTAGSNLQVSYLEEDVADKMAQYLTRRINKITVEEKAYGEQ